MSPESWSSSLLSWSPEFELGIPEIDAQHRCLLERVNQFAHALVRGNGAAEALVVLLQEVVVHFDFEEDLMQRAAYAGAQLHAEQHAELLASMHRMHGRLMHQSFADDRKKSLDFLHDWFSIHIVHTDAELARHLLAGFAG